MTAPETPEFEYVHVELAALMRVEYACAVRVPKGMSPQELEQLVDDLYEEVDGGDYAEDPEYWERSERCRVVVGPISTIPVGFSKASWELSPTGELANTTEQ